MSYQEEGDILRYVLDVISNIVSHPHQMNSKNTDSLFNDGILTFVITIMNKNNLSSDILASGIDCFDGLILNEKICVALSSKEHLKSIT
jgi:hypothetical protein